MSARADHLKFQAARDTSVEEVNALVTAAATGGHLAYIRDNSSQVEVELPRAEIERVERKNSFLAKRVIVHMQDGSAFTFNYGMLSTKKLIAALA